MGQNFSNTLEEIKDDVVKEAHIIKEVIDITHKELLSNVKQINEVLMSNTEVGKTRLEFRIKEGTDTTFLWKQTIRILCVRHYYTDESNNEIKEVMYKLLNLRQFLIGYKMIIYHINYKQDTEHCEGANSRDTTDLGKQFSASMILDKIADVDLEDCIICMERRPEVTLPCTHAYCLVCIEQWNVSNKTCPVCRASVENTDDSWVTPDIPNSSEVNAEVQKALTQLTLNLPEDD